MNAGVNDAARRGARFKPGLLSPLQDDQGTIREGADEVVRGCASDDAGSNNRNIELFAMHESPLR